MSRKELIRLEIMQRLASRQLDQSKAASLLELRKRPKINKIRKKLANMLT